MRIAVALCLMRVIDAAAIAKPDFQPTTEWQFVPDGVAVPGGLEIKMDLSAGGRWARIPPHSDYDTGAPAAELAVPIFDLSSIDLDALEEKAPGYDDGADIIREYGPTLCNTFEDPTNPHYDQAGRILGICLRNNGEAARNLIQSCPDLPSQLHLDRRSLLITSALVSTQDGLLFAKQTELLSRLRSTLASPAASGLDAAAAVALRKLLVNLAVAGEDGEDMCLWVAALQQAAYTSKHDDLKQLALEIVEHKGEFSGLTVNCAVQPGLLPVQNEAKRAEATASRLPNPKARRNHFDEL